MLLSWRRAGQSDGSIAYATRPMLCPTATLRARQEWCSADRSLPACSLYAAVLARGAGRDGRPGTWALATKNKLDYQGITIHNTNKYNNTIKYCLIHNTRSVPFYTTDRPPMLTLCLSLSVRGACRDCLPLPNTSNVSIIFKKTSYSRRRYLITLLFL